MFYPGGVLRGTLPVQQPGWARACGLLLWRLWQNFFQSGQTKTARIHSHRRDSLRVLHYRSLAEIVFYHFDLTFMFSGCDKKFTSKFKLKRHILIHSQTKTFLCDVCHRAFRRKDHLKNHEKVKHCIIAFDTKPWYLIHFLFKVHDPSKTVYSCSVEACGRTYNSLSRWVIKYGFTARNQDRIYCFIMGCI